MIFYIPVLIVEVKEHGVTILWIINITCQLPSGVELTKACVIELEVQMLAERLSGCVFPALRSRRATSINGFVCKLLDFCGHGLLQLFCPTSATPPTHTHGLRSLANDALLFSSSIRCTSLDLFRRSFISAIPDIWTAAPVELRLRGADLGWSTILKHLQKYVREMPIVNKKVHL